MTGAKLAEMMKSGARVYGTLVVSPSPVWLRHIGGIGLDFVFIDTEHIPLGRDALSWMCRAYRTAGIPPIVRIPSPDPYQACMAIDAGACGVMAPYLETAVQVRALYGAVKLRPLKGKKLQDALDGRTCLDEQTKQYLAEQNKDHLLLLNIESTAGIGNLNDMLSVPGVDGVIIGPHDLSISLDIPEQYRHKRFDEAVCAIVKAARSRGVGAGNHFSYGTDQEIGWAKQGMNILLHSSDVTAFVSGIGGDLAAMRAALGDTANRQSSTIDI